MSHRCAQSVNVNRFKTRDWAFIIQEVKDVLKIVHKEPLLKKEALKWM